MRFLSVRCEQREDAEELAQESFLRAWRNLDRYDPTRSFTSWLFTIAARLSISHLRRGSLRAGGEEELERVEDDQPRPDEEVGDRERDENLWILAREHLSTDQRSALWLHYVEGLSTGEVAGVLTKLESSTRVTLHRARERLRRVLEAGERALPATKSPSLGYSRTRGA